MLQLAVGQLHQAPQRGGVVVAGKPALTDLLAQDVMGRRGHQAADVAALLLGDMPEGGRGRNGHACLLHGSVKLGFFTKLPDDGHGRLTVDGTGVVRENPLLVEGAVAVLHADHVAAEAGAAGLQRDAAAGGLQRTAAGEIPIGVAAENGQNGCVAAGRQEFRYRADASQRSRLGQGVDHRLDRGFQRRFSVQFRQRIIRHAVSDH